MKSSRFDYIEVGEFRECREGIASEVSHRGRMQITEIIGSYGSAAGEFNAPSGIALDRDGAIYVADTYNHRVQKITPEGDVYAFGAKGNEPGRFLFPWGITVDVGGCIYVSDRSDSAVQKFTSRGTFVLGIGRRGSPVSCLQDPADVALDRCGNIWVVDTGNNRLGQFTNSGRFLKCIGHSRVSPVQFSRPQGIAVGPEERLYVSDTRNRRILLVDPVAGNIRTVLGADGQQSQFALEEPTGIAVDAHANVYVADTSANRVLCLTSSGETSVVLDQADFRGTSLNGPKGLAVSQDGSHLFVVDSLNHRILHLSLC